MVCRNHANGIPGLFDGNSVYLKRGRRRGVSIVKRKTEEED
jgi:hypothetical protein